MDEEALIVLGIIVGSLVLLLINYLIAAEFYEAAVMKGHAEKKYLWLAFFFGIIGYLLVVALPNNNAAASEPGAENKKPAKSVNDALPEL